jgi:hypothetical protein
LCTDVMFIALQVAISLWTTWCLSKVPSMSSIYQSKLSLAD